MTTTVVCFQFDTVQVYPGVFEVRRDGRVLPLEPKSIRVLMYLLENRERAVSKDELLQAVWADAAVTDNSLTRVIAQLRRELGDDARNPRYIQTVPTLGYRFMAEVAVVEPAEEPVAAAVPAAAQRAPVRPVWLYAAGALLAVIAVVLIAWRRPPAASRPATAAPIQVTTSPGLDLGASFSPDGQKLVYSSDRSGTFQIYIRPVEAAPREVQLTRDDGQNIQPTWSPDGRQIAWHSVTRRGIWVAPADGSGPARQVVQWGSQPAWSPDSRRIAYRSGDAFSVSVHDLLSVSKTTIQVANADGSGAPVTVSGTAGTSGRRGFPVWTPDGKRVVFSALGDGAGELWSVLPDGTSPRRLVRRERNVFVSPVFSPSGDSVYFGGLADKTRDLGIWQQKLTRDGSPDGAPVEIARTGNAVPMYLSVSRDGKRLAYTSLSSTSHLWGLPMRGFEAAGAAKALYEDNVSRASFPTFSPDGRRIAFFARLFGGDGDIWTVNADGSGAAQMKAGGTPEVMPDWTQDGSSIRYGRITRKGVQLWERRVSDHSDRPATLGSRAVPGWPRVSPDGRRVVYHSLGFEAFGQGVLNIFTAGLPDMADTRQLTRDGEGAGFPAWSPDNRWIAYELVRGPHSYLAVMDANGNGQEQLNVDPGHAWVFGWSPDGSKILFAGFREGVWNLWWLDRKTREQKRLTDYRSLRTYVRYPAWSPKGDQIAYELGTTLGNVYRIEVE